ncbi:Hypothetical predicted protein, partial [Pelobates cultripes]
MQDPSRNRLVQWTNQESNQGVVSMEFQLNDDAAPGNYFITAERSSGSDVVQWFTVDEYGIQVRKSSYTWMTSELAKLYFDYGRMNTYYKRGLPFKASVVLTDEKNNPMQGEKIELEINRNIIQNVTTNADGRATYEIDTSNFVEDNFTIKASYKNPNQCYFIEWRGLDTPDYPTAEYMALRFYSVSGNFLQIQSTQEELSCWKSHSITVSYVLTAAGIGKDVCGNEKLARSSKDTDEFTFYHMVISGMKIIHSGQKNVPVTNC